MDVLMSGLVVALSLIGAFLGSLLAGYARKKRENWATEENLGKLAEIVERIESKVSADLWAQQERYERKQDFYAKLIPLFHEAIAIYQRQLELFAESLPAGVGKQAFLERLDMVTKEIEENATRLRAAYAEVRAFASAEVGEAMLDFSGAVVQLRFLPVGSRPEDVSAYLRNVGAMLENHQRRMIEAVRRDLERPST